MLLVPTPFGPRNAAIWERSYQAENPVQLRFAPLKRHDGRIPTREIPGLGACLPPPLALAPGPVEGATRPLEYYAQLLALGIRKPRVVVRSPTTSPPRSR